MKHNALSKNQIYNLQNTQEVKDIKKKPSFSNFVIDADYAENRLIAMGEEVTFGDGLFVLGQFSVVFAQPNSGKTLLIINSLIKDADDGIFNPEDVFYINADDSERELMEKAILFKEHNMNMIGAGHKGFRLNNFLDCIESMIINDEARGKIIIVDTLKKFVDTMSKNESKQFNIKMSAFSQSGGTIILLGHVNKNKTADGKLIYAGTSDIHDDAHATYYINVTSEEKAIINGVEHIDKVVTFTGDKIRGGDGESEVTYKYQRKSGATYKELLESVKRISKEEAQIVATMSARDELLKENSDAIDIIESGIKQDLNLKGKLLKHLMNELTLPRRKADSIIDAHTGEDWQAGHRWYVTRTASTGNSKIYKLLPPPPEYQRYK